MKVNYDANGWAVSVDMASLDPITRKVVKSLRFAQMLKSLDGLYGVNPEPPVANFIFDTRQNALDAMPKFEAFDLKPIVPDIPVYFDRRYIQKLR